MSFEEDNYLKKTHQVQKVVLEREPIPPPPSEIPLKIDEKLKMTLCRSVTFSENVSQVVSHQWGLEIDKI